MREVIEEIFTTQVIEELRKQQSASDELKRRLEVLTAGEGEKADLPTRCWQRILVARRSAWASYITSMSEVGLLDADLRARLTGTDDDGFRSALAECLTFHFLTRTLQLNIRGRGEGRTGKVPDFSVRHADGNINVEVKSPYVAVPKARVWFGDRSAEVLQPTLDEANKQFAGDRRNVLALVPFVDFPMLNGRRPYVKAFLGETKVVITIDKTTGRSVREPEWRFITEGKFLKLWPEPRFTRTGAVLALREQLIEENQFDENCAARVEVRWFVIHNPHCPQPIPSDIWGDCAQLVREGDNIRWTDGGPVDGSPIRRKRSDSAE